jgi:hypothetical protein
MTVRTPAGKAHGVFTNFCTGYFLIFIVMIRSVFIALGCMMHLMTTAQQLPRTLTPATVRSRFLLHCTDTVSLHRLIAGANDSAAITYGYGNAIAISAYPQWVSRHLLTNPSIVFISYNNRKAKEEVIVNGFDYTTNHITTAHRDFPLLDGRNTVVSVKEEKPDTTDIDLRGRFRTTVLQSPRISSHATIMSTIIAGAGNSFYTGKGVAGGSILTSSSFERLLPDSDEFYQRYAITVQNHSYGTGIENYYGAETAAYDASVMTNPALLHVFSSGNSGDQADSAGVYKGLTGWANLTGNFKMAKNILTVGSIDSFYEVPLLSSKGPAYDGRVKPELAAYGEDGSSGAAALVSGTALLLQQAWQQQHGGSPAPAALVKALLLNTAGESGNKGIDFSSGFGSLDAWRAVKEMQTAHYFTGDLAQGEELSFSFSLPSEARSLKILLCWTDPPAVPNAAMALVNDLDIGLTFLPSGGTWLPWVLNSAPDKDSLIRLPVRGRDTLNNEEQITLDTAAAGDYKILVRGTRLGQGRQSFFVVYQWDSAASFRWMYPTANDNLLPGQSNILRWQTNGSSPALLEYRLIGESNWQTAQTTPAQPLSPQSLPTTDQYCSWLAPDTTALALLRLTTNGQPFISDTFTLSPRLTTGVGFNCPDSFLLYWDKNPAGNYALYRLGDRYLQEQKTVTDTSLVLPVSTSVSNWYAIAPVLPGNKPGLKSYAFDYTQQGVGCYISSFTADINGVTGSLLLDLGSIYQVHTIAIEKATVSAYRTLTEFSPAGLEYAVADSSLTQGVNAYRAKIILNNGQILYSTLQTIYYTGNRSYFLYPNPVFRPQPIHILANELNNPVFRLFTVSGQLVLEKTLTQLQEDIPTHTLSRGFYFYSLQAPGGDPIRGKLIVL